MPDESTRGMALLREARAGEQSPELRSTQAALSALRNAVSDQARLIEALQAQVNALRRQQSGG